MDVYEVIDGVLAKLGLPFFEGMPEFDMNEPESYYTYTAATVPSQSADDAPQYEEYDVDVNLFTPAFNAAQISNTTASFEKAGFIWQGDWPLPAEKTFPYKRRRAFEFRIAFERS